MVIYKVVGKIDRLPPPDDVKSDGRSGEPIAYLIDPDLVEPPADPSAAAPDKGYDAWLFKQLDGEGRSLRAGEILDQRKTLSEKQIEFEEQRVLLMKQAVASAIEVNRHLWTWRGLAWCVPVLLLGTLLATFNIAYRLLDKVQNIDGWQLAALLFVLALVAISPATLLLIGRPLKGLDEWNPGKVEAAAEAPDTSTTPTPEAA